MLRVDEGGEAAQLLGVGHDVQHDRGLARGFRTVDFHDAAAGNAAGAEGEIERKRARRDDVDHHIAAGVAKAHDAAFAEALFDLRDGRVEVTLTGGIDRRCRGCLLLFGLFIRRFFSGFGVGFRGGFGGRGFLEGFGGHR